jgi:Icc-related predicted phosphoesterase
LISATVVLRRMTFIDKSQSNHRQFRIAAMADLHCKKDLRNSFNSAFSHVGEKADVLLLCGDLTDYGLVEEAKILAEEIKPAVERVPVIAVLGNHDYESGHAPEIRETLLNAGITLLDGDSTVINGIGFAGVKGFCGGFDDRVLQAWGEEILKSFVQEAISETLKLESALAKLKTAIRIALLHYSPIATTVEGEPSAIFPFLGTSRLEDPLNRFRVFCAFHGHAHYGSPEGKTHGGIPVYNVAVPLLKRHFPHQYPFRIVEVNYERNP